MRVNITLACTECGERNYITKRISETIQIALNSKSIAHVIKNKLYIVKQSKRQGIFLLFFMMGDEPV